MEDVGRMTGDRFRAGRAQSDRGAADVRQRLGDHVRAPVGGDEDDVDLERGDRARQPVEPSLQIGVGNAGSRRAGREISRVVAASDHAKTETVFSRITGARASSRFLPAPTQATPASRR
jgi:hypothetical protein